MTGDPERMRNADRARRREAVQRRVDRIRADMDAARSADLDREAYGQRQGDLFGQLERMRELATYTDLVIDRWPGEPGRATFHPIRGLIEGLRACRGLMIDSERVVADEVLIETDVYWRARNELPWSLRAEGFLVPVTEALDLWSCACPRRFATPEALATHGCPVFGPEEDEPEEAGMMPSPPPTRSDGEPRGIQGLSWRETLQVYRRVLDLTEQDQLNARQIGKDPTLKRLARKVHAGAEADVLPDTIRTWRSKARKARERGLL